MAAPAGPGLQAASCGLDLRKPRRLLGQGREVEPLLLARDRHDGDGRLHAALELVDVHAVGQLDLVGLGGAVRPFDEEFEERQGQRIALFVLDGDGAGAADIARDGDHDVILSVWPWGYRGVRRCQVRNIAGRRAAPVVRPVHLAIGVDPFGEHVGLDIRVRLGQLRVGGAVLPVGFGDLAQGTGDIPQAPPEDSAMQQVDEVLRRP